MRANIIYNVYADYLLVNSMVSASLPLGLWSSLTVQPAAMSSGCKRGMCAGTEA